MDAREGTLKNGGRGFLYPCIPNPHDGAFQVNFYVVVAGVVVKDEGCQIPAFKMILIGSIKVNGADNIPVNDNKRLIIPEPFNVLDGPGGIQQMRFVTERESNSGGAIFLKMGIDFLIKMVGVDDDIACPCFPQLVNCEV